MNQTMYTAAVVIGVGIAFGVGGYFAGQSAWDDERETLESQLTQMETQLEGLKDKVRQRQMARKGRSSQTRPPRGARERRVPQVPLRPEYWPVAPRRGPAKPKAPTSGP